MNTVDENKTGISVLIVDDDETFSAFLRKELMSVEGKYSDLTCRASIEEAIRFAATTRPGLIFMDIEFGDSPLNGLDAATQIWTAHPAARIVIVSNKTDARFVQKLYSLAPEDAAYGWMLKNSLVEHLHACVTQVCNDDNWIDPSINMLYSRIQRRVPGLDSDTDYRILGLLSLGYKDKVIGDMLCLCPQAIGYHLGHLYTRFGLPKRGDGIFNPRARIVWLALKDGLINAHDLPTEFKELIENKRKVSKN